MIDLKTCPNCGLQFDLDEKRGRCPSCGKRVSTSNETDAGGPTSRSDGQVFFSSDGRVRFASFSQFNVGGWMLGLIASSILFPVVLTFGLIAAIFGVVFDIQPLLIGGGIALVVAGLMFLYFLSKLISGIRRAAGLLKDVRAQMGNLDVIEGSWRRKDDTP